MTNTDQPAGAATQQFRTARDFLLTRRMDYSAAYRDFVWPELDRFNWALNWFDVISRGNDRLARTCAARGGGPRRRLAPTPAASLPASGAAGHRCRRLHRSVAPVRPGVRPATSRSYVRRDQGAQPGSRAPGPAPPVAGSGRQSGPRPRRAHPASTSRRCWASRTSCLQDCTVPHLTSDVSLKY